MKNYFLLVLYLFCPSYSSLYAQQLSKADSVKIAQFKQIDALNDQTVNYTKETDEITFIIHEFGYELRRFLQELETNPKTKEEFKNTKNELNKIINAINAETDSLLKHIKSESFQSKLADYDLDWKSKSDSSEHLRFSSRLKREIVLRDASVHKIAAIGLDASVEKPKLNSIAYATDARKGELLIQLQTKEYAQVAFVIYNEYGEKVYEASQLNFSKSYRQNIDINQLAEGSYVLAIGENNRFLYHELTITSSK